MTVKLYDRLTQNQSKVVDLEFSEGTGVVTCDISKYHNNGTISNGVWTQLASGVWSLTFNGATTYITCGGAASVLPAAWTVGAWVKTTTASSILWGFLDAVGLGIALEWGGTGSPIIIFRGTNYQYFASTAWDTIKDGGWHRVIFTCPGSGQNDVLASEMYVDRKYIARTGASVAGTQNVKSVCLIGRNATVGGDKFNGQMVDWFLSNTVWTAKQVNDDYFATRWKVSL